MDSVVSSAIGSRIHCIDCVCSITDFSALIYFSNGINSSIVWDTAVTDTAVIEGSDGIGVWTDEIVGKRLPCCSDVYLVSPVYFYPHHQNLPVVLISDLISAIFLGFNSISLCSAKTCSLTIDISSSSLFVVDDADQLQSLPASLQLIDFVIIM